MSICLWSSLRFPDTNIDSQYDWNIVESVIKHTL